MVSGVVYSLPMPATKNLTEHTFTAPNGKAITLAIGKRVHAKKMRGIITAIVMHTDDEGSWVVVEARPLALSAKGKPFSFKTWDITAVEA